MAYVLGFFAADGTMIKNRRGAHFIEFHITDRCVLEIIQEKMSSNHKISIRGRKQPQHRIGYRLQLGSKSLFFDLQSLGFTSKKSLILKFPTIPEIYTGDFIRGYFDGDGCVYFKHLRFADRKHPRHILMTRFTCGSSLFLTSLHIELKKHGVTGGIVQKKQSGNAFDLVFSHRDSLALFHLMYDTVAEQRLFLPRKYKLFRKGIETLYPNMRV